MLHPHRSLQDLVDGELADGKRVSVERHVARCTPCSNTVARLRDLKSTLLGLQNPCPDPALRSKLLAADFGASTPVAGGVPFHAGPRGRDRGRAPDHAGTADSRRRTLVAAAGGLTIVTAALLAGAYVVGSETAPVPAEAASGTSALRAGWESVAAETPTPLDTQQLDTLRAGGWYCPELESLGFTLRSAEGSTVAGRPTLELVLENGGETVTVYEQRKVDDVGPAGRPGGPPVTAVTGELVTSSGFDHIGGTDRDVWVRSGEPWQVVLDSPSVTYTVVSTLPASAMPGTLSQLVTTEHAQLALAPQPPKDSMVERIIRGLSTMTHPEPVR